MNEPNNDPELEDDPLEGASESERASQAPTPADIAPLGGRARAESLTPEERSEIARNAAAARWRRKDFGALPSPKDADAPDAPGPPLAKYKGVLEIMDAAIPCYVLTDGTRVIGRVQMTEMLTKIRGGGALEKYLGVEALKPFIDMGLVLERMQPFSLPEVEGLDRAVKGMPTGLVIDVCRGLVAALEATNRRDYPGRRLTERQEEIATRAGLFLAACAKVGLDALVDEVTGYQEVRAADALRVKLSAYLEEEMRKWEKTFPDELWIEFGRLTNWKGSVTKRPKFWGKLVMEFVYEYLDADVARWLRDNAPAPRKGQNYHQWLSSQYGLKRLVEHIWKLIGIASTSKDIGHLRRRMRKLYGKPMPIQLTLFEPNHLDDDEDEDEEDAGAATLLAP